MRMIIPDPVAMRRKIAEKNVHGNKTVGTLLQLFSAEAPARARPIHIAAAVVPSLPVPVPVEALPKAAVQLMTIARGLLLRRK